MHRRSSGREECQGGGQTRREFLKRSALAAAAAATAGSVRASLPGPDAGTAGTYGRGNLMPGRIVLYHDARMEGHLVTINRDRVEQVVLHGVRLLTGIDDTAAAFESLFPGLHSGSTIAVKVNCLGPTDTRWETARGLVSGLSQMLGGTYDVSQVTIFDPHPLYSHGYRCDNGQFVFNGNCPQIYSYTSPDPTYYVYGGHRLSSYLTTRDYVINAPALKCHDRPLNQLTLALKNHYGSCSPQSLCDNIPGMLTVNADPNIKDKTALVLMCGLRGTYQGGPSTPPQVWETFPEASPNTLFFSTDPVTNEYWGRDMINAERVAQDYSPKPAPWVEEASGDPYNLGVSEPADMTMLYYDPTDVPEDGPLASATFLAPNVPNPFAERTAVRFRLAAPASARLTVVDAAGRLVRHLGEQSFPAGYSAVEWNGRNERGARVATGTYFARLEVNGLRRTRPLLLVR